LKKIQDQRTAAGSGYFKKTSQNCRVSRKPGKEEPGRFLGGYFTFTIWDLGFRTSTDGQTTQLIYMIPMLATSSLQASSRSGSKQVLVQVLGHLDGRFNNFYGTVIGSRPGN
jgi:hypothetical protein